jgi:hypothetical protein
MKRFAAAPVTVATTAVAIVLVSVVALVVLTVSAGAAPWPVHGGDGGRSGFQAVDGGGVPAAPAWSRTATDDRDVRTSIVVGDGADPSKQRVVYGTDNGRVHVRVLLTGARVGPSNGVSVSAAANPFGGGSASVTPVDVGGQAYVLHNERFVPPDPLGTPGVELAQIDESTGQRARDDVTLAAAAGYVVESSPVIGPPLSGSAVRSLFFVARQEGGTNEQLFKIDITNPGSPTSTIGTVSSTGDINANPQASPTLVWLNAPDGTPTPYVAVGTVDSVRTYRVTDLAPGPSAVGIGLNLRTPSTPVTPSGNPPGSPGSGVAVTPAIYVASSDGTSTFVHRLTQSGTSDALSVTTSVAIDGDAANGLATDQLARASGPAEGRVYVTTSKRLVSLRTTDLAALAGRDGSFRNVVAAATGNVLAVADDSGGQSIFLSDDLSRVPAELFTPIEASTGSKTSFGQPAISRRFLVFANDKGLFAYSLRRAAPPTGYWLVASDGGVFTFGDAPFLGSTGDIVLNKPIVGTALTPTDQGYWMVASDGGVFAFGDAGFFGSTGAMTLNSPVVGMAPTPTGQGYWLVAADGGIFAFGDAAFFGSTGAMKLNKPIVGMAATVTGLGYWLVASDGGIFAFGDAVFFGSTGAIALNKPIVGMASEPSGRGYWLVASDGGVFAFGRAPFFGSTGDIVLNSPIVGMSASATGLGYLFTASDGGVFAFGDAPFLGSTGNIKLNRPVVAMVVQP